MRIDAIMDAPMYRDILEQHMLPFAREKMPEEWVFMQDNDPKHVSKLMMGGVERSRGSLRMRIKTGWFSSNGVCVMRTPAYSPDINPIEHLWAIVKQKLKGRRFKNKDELWTEVQKIWKAISLDTLIKLVDSMPSRINAIIRAKGGVTKY